MIITYNKNMFSWKFSKTTLIMQHIPPFPLRYSIKELYMWLGFIVEINKPY